MAGADDIPSLIGQLAENAGDLGNVLAALAHHCASDAAAVVAAGGLQQIVRLAAEPNPNTAQQAARCLRHITAAHEQNRAAVKAKAVDALVELLGQEQAAEEAAWALL